MLVAFILMNHTKIPANLLSLGAIDFGIIVDGAIVMTEAILRRREAKPDRAAHRSRRPRRPRTRWRGRSSSRPLIIITTYLPLFAFQRIEAKLFYPMAYAVGYAQFGALLFALTAGAGPGLSRLSQAAARLPQSRAGLARGAHTGERCSGSLQPARHRLRR